MQPVVWHISSNRWNSAITEYALSAARAFEILGWKTIFSPLAGSPAETRARALGLTVQPFRSASLADARRFRRLAIEHAPQMILVYGGPETVLSKLRPRGCRVVRFRGQDLPPGLPGFAGGLKHGISHGHVDVMLAPSAYLAAKIAAWYPAATVRTVPLGCDTQRFHYKPRPATRRPEATILGRFDPVKGHAALFELFASVKKLWPKDRPSPLLHVVGQPANLTRGDIERAAVAAGLTLDQDVRLTVERVAHISDVLSSADLGVISSIGSEIICRVAHEFLLCGAPVLVSGVGSLKDVLFPGAGHSYGGLALEAAARLFADALVAAHEETEETRLARADQAKEVYSLEAMADGLQRALDL